MFFVPSEVACTTSDAPFEELRHKVSTIKEELDEENGNEVSGRSPVRPGFDPKKYLPRSMPHLTLKRRVSSQSERSMGDRTSVSELANQEDRPLMFRSVSQIRRMMRKSQFDDHSISTRGSARGVCEEQAEGEGNHLLEKDTDFYDAMSCHKNDSSNEEDDQTEDQPMDTLSALKEIIFGKYINLLLVCVPFGWASHYCQWDATYVFWLNFFAMIPLASILGDFTEDLACHTNQIVGGLLNATFGNAVELVVGIQALLKDEIRLVQATMIGSILSNLLLVLGCCFLFGGLRYKEQYFNTTSTTANMSLLALSSIALVLPSPFAAYYDIEDETVLKISRAAAVFLVLMYAQLLVFQIRTHSYLMEDESEDPPSLPFSVGFISLAFVTLIITISSDFLVDSIDGFTKESGISRTFVGLVILPIVGNVVEHLTAVMVAMKDKMDLAVSIAVGSSTQISLFVIPAIVLAGWAADKNMTLNFPTLEIVLFIMSVVIVHICLGTGKSHWLLGSLLTTTYLMVAVGFWFERVQPFDG